MAWRCATTHRRGEEKSDSKNPGDRGQSEDRGDREEDDPKDASDDVETVGMQGTEGDEYASDASRRSHHDKRDEDEYQWQGEPYRERWCSEEAVRSTTTLSHREDDHESDGEEQEGGQ